ncbi:MFS transporter [Klebsiella pneumoniae subsp. pneumoniae]|nr:MFS transporter [Klebsiella pneumoniae subsp. pneumoniae]
MKSRAYPEKDNNKVSYGALLAPQVKPIVIIGMVLAIFQQWCGINVIFNYAQEIFASAGFDINSTLKSIVATGVVNLVFTIAALPLVDKIGRRKLMLLGASGLTLIYVLIAGAYAMGIMGWPVLLLVLAAIAIYALTLAPVTWVLLAEIFPNRVRGLAMSLGTLALWIACFLLTYTFPLLNAGLGAAGSFPAVWCYLRCRLPLYPAQRPGNERYHPRSAGRAAGAASYGR